MTLKELVKNRKIPFIMRNSRWVNGDYIMVTRVDKNKTYGIYFSKSRNYFDEWQLSFDIACNGWEKV